MLNRKFCRKQIDRLLYIDVRHTYCFVDLYLCEFEPVLDPHGAAVKVDQHPFVWVEVEGISKINSLHQIPRKLNFYFITSQYKIF